MSFKNSVKRGRMIKIMQEMHFIRISSKYHLSRKSKSTSRKLLTNCKRKDKMKRWSWEWGKSIWPFYSKKKMLSSKRTNKGCLFSSIRWKKVRLLLSLFGLWAIVMSILKALRLLPKVKNNRNNRLRKQTIQETMKASFHLLKKR